MEGHIDPKLEHMYRRGYSAGVFDVLASLALLLSDEDRQIVENWAKNDLAVWRTMRLNEAVRPPDFPLGSRPDVHGPWPA
ncbi:hypothetical protein NKH49_22150 [Mesorhizobium sp. M1088]|uniref:hypothetical protein n=1 Tax=Mesorhizobium sp. M1088 TaxID=2957056 RepID=UPI0033353423